MYAGYIEASERKQGLVRTNGDSSELEIFPDLI
jgi:hypothetical protein